MNETNTTTEDWASMTREAQVAAALNALALADGWTGWAGRISDVPSATDWLVDHDHQIQHWAAVNRILSRYVCEDISIQDACAELQRVLG